MLSRIISPIVEFLTENRAKLGRYVGAAMVIVPIGLAVFWLFMRLTDWDRWFANVVATCVMVTPNYLLNRYWVWEKNDANRFLGEVVPFFVMALIGLLVSTVAVGAAEQFVDNDLFAIVVNLASFGAVWVAKFFVLDKLLFNKTQPTPVSS